MRAVFLISPALIVFLFLFNLKGYIFALSTNVVINEIMAKPSSGTNEWVELYNPTSNAIDLTNWKIKDANSLDSDDIKLEGQIESLGFRVFEHTSGWLNDSGGETVSLLDGSSTAIDSYQYNSALTDKTFGRVPDGESWQSNLSPTKGSNNQSAVGSVSPSPSTSTSPTNTPYPTPTPTPSPTSSFTISNTPDKIKSSDSFRVSTHLYLPNNPSSVFYLKGAFVKPGGENYFGFTKAGNTWIKNSANFSDQKQITTDYSGLWLEDLEVKPDTGDKGFSGNGFYTFKVARYNSSGSGPTWSAEVEIYIEDENSSSTKTTDTLAKNNLSENQLLSNQKIATGAASESGQSLTDVASNLDIIDNDLSQVAGLSTSSSGEETVSGKKFIKSNWFLIPGGILIAGLGIGFFVFIWKKGIKKI